MKLMKISYCLVVLLLTFSCNTKKEKTAEAEQIPEPISLKNSFKSNFYIGVALDSFQISESDSTVNSLITNEFSSITPENIMKSMFIHPEKDRYDFRNSDNFVAFGEKNNMQVHGHTLVWHSQLSPWMEKITDSTEMALAVEDHINTIVNKYKGRINSWDVVNEALNEDGTLRESVFLKTLGKDYISDVFKQTALIDPEAELYYNDYNLCDAEKRSGVVALVKSMQENGAKIDGVGMQGHWGLEGPSLEEIEKSILTYADLGVKVAITELDITVLPNPWDLVGAEVSQNFENSEELNPYKNGLPDSIQTKLAKRYKDIFKLFLKHEDKISRVTFWGVHDGHTWLNNWPIEGRTNHPLLFDRKLKSKQAYDSIISLKK